MHRASRSTLIALSFLCLLRLWPAPPVSPPSGGPGSGVATIEPTLPLTIDLRPGPAAQSRAGGGRIALEVEIEAGPDISDLSLALVLPDGLRAEEDPLPSDHTIALRAAERRLYVVPLIAARAGIFPVQVEASFRDDQGRTFRTRQGIDLRFGPPRPEGRSHAGAYEVMAVPLQELGR